MSKNINKNNETAEVVKAPAEETQVETSEDVRSTAKASKSARELRWEAHVEGYAVANPVKYAAKKARGEFDKAPESFK